MKKNGVLLLILFFCFQRSWASFSTVAITSGFNADIIANGVGNASSSATAFDISNAYAFVSADFQAVAGDAAPSFALPSNGFIFSETTNGLHFQLASYTANNALQLTETNGTGTLNLSVSNVADVYFLVSSANGSSDFTATIHFSDGTTQTSSTLSASDWYSNPNYAKKGVGRVGLSGNNLDGDADNPRIYQVVFHLDPANYAKTITSITFSSTESNGTTMSVMGVSVNTACSGAPAAASVLSTATSVCPGVVFTLSLSNTYVDGGISYQWETSDNNSTWTPVANGGTDATFTTNEAAATYYHCVITCAGGGLSTTTASLLVSLNSGTTCYCIPSYSTGCVDMFNAFYDINSVSINGENGTSINNFNTGCSVNNAYTDYTSSVPAVSLTPYSDYTLNLGTQSSSGNPSATVWIDLNDDGIFNDATERVGTTGTGSGLSVLINIPSATAGNHRMRISTVFFYGFTVDEPCGSYMSGETEDYMVDLLPTPTCIHPLNLTTTTVNQTDINAAWTAGASGTTYDYAVDETATAAPDVTSTITNIATNNVTLAAITPATTFYFHLRAHCSANDSSIWISKPFTLASTCANATTLAINNTTFGNSTSFTDVTLPVATCGDATGAVSHGMWYKVTPTTSGQLVVYTTIGTTFDSYLRVYSGSCAGLVCTAFNDNYNGTTSSLSFSAIANTTYYILMTGVTANDAGNYLLTVQSGPTNDEAVNATVLTPGAGCSGASYTNLGATASTGELYPKCSGFSALNPVWFSFVAPTNGTAKITTDYTSGTLTDSKLALFSATDVTNYSTFTLIGCDDNNGVTGSGQLSTLYATDLTPGATYYIAMDNGLSAPGQGTFCITVDAINPAYVSNAAVSCGAIQQPDGFNPTYTGWVSLVDGNGNLVAMVRNQNGGAVFNYSGAYTVYGTGIRQDANGRYYMNRNYFISNPTISTPVDLKLFFSPADYGYLSGISGGTGNPITMNDLNVTKQEGSTCEADYSEGLGTVSVLLQTGNNSANSVGWINLTTSSFSNFYIMAGTTPLLIELKDINAENQGKINRVTWSTASENAGDYFELERSEDAKQFHFLSRIEGHQQASDYVYNDNNPLHNVNYYRLKMLGINGKTTYSKVVQATVSANGTATMAVYPNPAGKQIKLTVSGTENGTVTLTDISGRTIYQATMNGTEMNIDMTPFMNGFYLIHYVDEHLNKVIKINKQ